MRINLGPRSEVVAEIERLERELEAARKVVGAVRSWRNEPGARYLHDAVTEYDRVLAEIEKEQK